MRLLSTRLFAGVFVLASFVAAGAPGDLDPAFGVGGIQALDFGQSASTKIMATARQSDGRIVVAGRSFTAAGVPKLAVGRLNADGTQDTTFGTNGWTVLQGDLHYNDTTPIAATVMQNDAIAVVGVRNFQTYLAILSANGVVSQSGSDGGFVMDYDSFAEEPLAIAYLPSGSLVVAGAYALYPNRDAYVTVYSPEGFRRRELGNNGRFLYALSPGYDEARAIMVQPDSSFFLAGYADSPGGDRDFALAKVNSSFQLNTAFGTNGVKTVDFGGQDVALAMAQENLGHFIVVGRSEVSAVSSRFALARISTSTGDLDPNYGDLGRTVTAVSASYGAFAQIVSVVSLGFFDGVVVAGNLTHDDGLFPVERGMVIARYHGGGQPYPGFGTNGVVFTTPSPMFGDTAASIQRVGSDQVLAVGHRGFAGSFSALAARHSLFTGAPEASFGPGGVAEYYGYMPSQDTLESLVRLADGRFVGLAVADYNNAMLFRINADGSWDETFGFGGAMALPIGVRGPLAVQPDGKLLVGHVVDMPCGGPNTTCSIPAVSRFNAEGSTDNTFNGNGRVLVDFGPVGHVTTALSVFPDGRIVVAAQVPYQPAGYALRFGVAQIFPNGVVDFKTVIDRPGAGDESPRALALLPDGRMLVSGLGGGGQVVYRFSFNGAMDPSWGVGGVATAGCFAQQRSGLAAGSDGSVSISGYLSNAACFARFTASGALDPSFGSGGVQTHSFPGGDATGIALQADGRLVASIRSTPTSSIARLNPDGSLDASLNGTGFASIPLRSYASGVFLQPDGMPVVWGDGGASADNDALIVRFQGGGAPSGDSPDPFAFIDLADVMESSLIVSNAVTITGLNASAPISVMGGEYSLGCSGLFTATAALIHNQDSVCVRHFASAQLNTATNTVLTIGGFSDTFTSVTRATSGPPLDTWIMSSSIGPGGNATFGPASTDPSATFECRLDGAFFSECSSPISYTGLAEGSHTFETRARVGAVVDTTPASMTWTVDATPPDTILLNGPSGAVASTSATFTFAASEEGAFFVCGLDGAQLAQCSSPAAYTGLAQGAHTFKVAAFDGNGNVDPTPIEVTWTVDTVAPETTIVSGPSGSMTATSVTLTFTANEAATFECRLDGAAFAGCASPISYSGLAEGTHTFAVRATDAVGNVDATPATAMWIIDSTPPETVITSAPSAVTSSQTSTFTFASNDPSATFECQRDNSAYAACTSPISYDNLVEGWHFFRVRAVDAAGQGDSEPAEHNWFIDISAPDTLITSGPLQQWPSSAATVTFQATEANATFQCALDGAAFVACSSPVTYTGLADGTHQLLVRSIDAVGNVDASPSVIAWSVDTVAPQTTITGGPSGTTSQFSATFTFASSESPAAFECRLDGSSFLACPNPASFFGLANGSHTIEVRAIDAAGNVDATADLRTWTIDSSAPETTITAAPASPFASSAASFSFTSSELPATYECNLDGQGWSACASPRTYSGLVEAMHQFQVRASDASGNVDASPASHQWLVDITAPDTTITSGPGGIVATTSATLSFTSNDASATFECRIDGAGFAACATPQAYTGLGQGAHTFDVRAKDIAGNLDATPASRSWTVDTAAPETTITSGPSGAAASTSASFVFSASEGGATFECRLDNAAFAGCTSPRSFSALAQGPHTFEVRSRDALGNQDASPASRSWTVDTVTPTTTITSGPPANTTSTTATFTFISNEPGVTFECKLDSAAFAACTTPKTYNGLSRTTHTFQVRAKDAAGNLDPSPATDTWRVR